MATTAREKYPFGLGSVGQPSLPESFIPVWGPGRGLIADLQEGDYAGAGLNAGLLALDVTGAGLIGKGLRAGAIAAKVAPSTFQAAIYGPKSWQAARAGIGAAMKLPRGAHAHHAIIANKQGRLSPFVPDAIKHHPLNIKVIANPEHHMRIHQKYKGQDRYGVVRRYFHGRPTWLQALEASAVGKTGDEAWEKRSR